ncbi:MAG: NUDIX domain-containing protein [bacterium]
MYDFNKAAAIVIKDGKLLMVKKNTEPFLAMLGGTIEKNETMIECLQREIPEEISISQFKIIDQKPFYVAHTIAGTDPTKTIEISCFQVTLLAEPVPSYDPLHPELAPLGRNITEVHWIGKNDLEIQTVENQLRVKLKPTLYSKEGKLLILTPITEEYIIPHLLEKRMIY